MSLTLLDPSFFLLGLKVDILQKFGYKKTLSAGLLLSAVGSFLLFCYNGMEFSFLAALFTVGLGFSIQIVANPLAIKWETHCNWCAV
jgi:FHS family L-fucose permease-like MFS transporter